MDLTQQRQPGGDIAGLAIVMALHVAIGYALINGLARTVVDVLKKPLDVAIIEEIKTPPPPPPQKIIPQQPRLEAPPPPFVPPPEVQVEAPAVQNVITTSSKPDPTPPAPLATTPPALNVALACPNHMEVRSRLPYPARAQQMGLSGDVLVEFTVTASGQINDVTVLKSTNPMFNSAATTTVGQLHCNGRGHDVRVRVPFVFRIES